MFDEMTSLIREDTAKMMLTLMPIHKSDVKRKAVAQVTSTTTGGEAENAKAVTVRKDKKIGPNDPCPCGSGLKYKKCCGSPAKLAAAAAEAEKKHKEEKRRIKPKR